MDGENHDESDAKSDYDEDGQSNFDVEERNHCKGNYREEVKDFKTNNKNPLKFS